MLIPALAAAFVLDQAIGARGAVECRDEVSAGRQTDMRFFLCVLVMTSGLAGCAVTGETASGTDEQVRDAQALLERAVGDALVRDTASGRWLGPAFYDLTVGSAGLQAGVDVSQVLVLVTTQKGVEVLLRPSSTQLGAEVSMTTGPLSAGHAATPADMVELVSSHGVYAGMSLEAAVIRPDEIANRRFYGRPVSAEEILVRGSVENPAAASLRDYLSRTASSQRP
jgi:hypothetical protein